jgi:HAD superfamily hydrolase (TIGR01549 family)
LTKAVIFDLDGTLINLPIDYDRLFQELGKIMKTKEVRPITTTVARLDEKTKKKAFEVWESIELDAFEKMTVNDEGMDLYRRFSDKPKALVTMQGITLTQNVFESLGLSFDSVITRADSLNRREQLELAAKKTGKTLRDTLFVGNTDEDAHAAEEAGCRFLKVGE